MESRGKSSCAFVTKRPPEWSGASVVGAHAFGGQHVVFNNWEDQGQRNAKTLMSILDANAIAP